MVSEYDVLVLEDDEMADDWMLIEHVEGMTLAVRRSAMGSPRTYAEAWAAFRALSQPVTVRRRLAPAG